MEFREEREIHGQRVAIENVLHLGHSFIISPSLGSCKPPARYSQPQSFHRISRGREKVLKKNFLLKEVKKQAVLHTSSSASHLLKAK